MFTFVQDFRYGLRTLANQPAFTTVAVLALALGIGANSAIFSVVDGVLLQPLPYSDPGRLVQLSERTPEFGSMSIAYPNLVDWRAQSHSFSDIAGIRWEDYDITGDGQAEHVSAKMVSAEFFQTLGIHPVIGRDFTRDDDRLGTTPVAIIDGGLWQRRYGSSPSVLGRQITMNGHGYTIIGVIPAGFNLRGKAEVFTLLGQFDDIIVRSREMHPGLYAVARLKPGVTIHQAQSEMDGIAARLANAYPKSNAKHGVTIAPLTDVIVGNVRPMLLVLLGAVGFVLLIACANVANLLLARSTVRRKEMALRSAMGASRGRLVRQMLTESLRLSLAGGAAGLLIANWGVRGVVAAVPGGLPRMENIGVNAMVLVFTLGLSLVTGVVFGVAPALQVSVANLHETLKESSRGSTGGPHRLRGLLVVSEVAAALLLLIGAGLMLRTIWQLGSVHPGFDTHNLLTLSVGLKPEETASPERALQTVEQTVDRLRGAPGVKAASMTTLLPLSGSDNEIPFYVNGRPRPTSQGDMLWALLYAVGPDYRAAMGIPLLRGRFLERRDSTNGAPVVVIDEVLAQSVFPNQDPIGQRISVADLGGALGPEVTRPMEIVGVVAHVKHWGLDTDASAKIRSQLYLPFAQIPKQFATAMASGCTYIARTGVDPAGVVPGVRRTLQQRGDRPVYNLHAMDEIVSDSIAGRRFSMLLLGIFGALAMVLAAVGIYGVISYSVAQRTNEIGIRMALGAAPRDVLRNVVALGMTPVLAGIGIGLAVSFALTRAMANMLYGVKTSDPATFIGVAAVLVVVALLACVIPARRATKIDPTVALRQIQ